MPIGIWVQFLGKRLGILRRMRVVRACIDLKLLDDLPGQPILGEHAPDGLDDHTLGVLFADGTGGD